MHLLYILVIEYHDSDPSIRLVEPPILGAVHMLRLTS